MSVGEIQKVLANLLKEGVSIRDMVSILETLADYAGVNNDPDVLTEYVRQQLSRTICKKFIVGNKARVIVLSHHVEELIMNSIQHTEQGTYVSIDPLTIQKIINKLRAGV